MQDAKRTKWSTRLKRVFSSSRGIDNAARQAVVTVNDVDSNSIGSSRPASENQQHPTTPPEFDLDHGARFVSARPATPKPSFKLRNTLRNTGDLWPPRSHSFSFAAGNELHTGLGSSMSIAPSNSTNPPQTTATVSGADGGKFAANSHRRQIAELRLKHQKAVSHLAMAVVLLDEVDEEEDAASIRVCAGTLFGEEYSALERACRDRKDQESSFSSWDDTSKPLTFSALDAKTMYDGAVAAGIGTVDANAANTSTRLDESDAADVHSSGASRMLRGVTGVDEEDEASK